MIEVAFSSRQGLVGTHNPASRFSEAQVAEIRKLRAKGMYYKQIAEAVGCSLGYAQAVCTGRVRAVMATRTARRLEGHDAQLVAELRAEGHSRLSIAQMLGATEASVDRLVFAIEAMKGT